LRRKLEAVLRMLRGESSKTVSREIVVMAGSVAGDSLASGRVQAKLRSRPAGLPQPWSHRRGRKGSPALTDLADPTEWVV
jgi:hypothetical protein